MSCLVSDCGGCGIYMNSKNWTLIRYCASSRMCKGRGWHGMEWDPIFMATWSGCRCLVSHADRRTAIVSAARTSDGVVVKPSGCSNPEALARII